MVTSNQSNEQTPVGHDQNLREMSKDQTKVEAGLQQSARTLLLSLLGLPPPAKLGFIHCTKDTSVPASGGTEGNLGWRVGSGKHSFHINQSCFVDILF